MLEFIFSGDVLRLLVEEDIYPNTSGLFNTNKDDEAS